MTPKLFENAMEKHVAGDREIDVKEGNKIAGKLGRHSKSFVKIIGIGKNHGDKDHKRAIANVTVHRDGEIPLMRGNDKDHKDELDMRPICNGMVGPKKPLSEMVSETLETILEVNENEICKSTEEMIYAFEMYNKHKTDEPKIIGSMDVKSLYPSIKAEEAAAIVREEIIMSKVSFTGLDVDEL